MTLLRKSLFIFLILLVVTSCTQDKSINLQPPTLASSPDAQDRSCAYFYYLLGAHAEYNQNFTEALEAYEKAFICDPEGDLILEKLVVTYMKMSNETKAAQYLQILIEKHPDNINRQLLLARLFVRLGKLDEAIVLYLKILNGEPKNESALLQLGLVYSIQKNSRQAETAFLSVIAINKDSYPANLYLAKLFAEMGKVKDALDRYNKSLALNWSPELINEIVKFCLLYQQYDELLRIYNLVLQRDPANETAGFGMVHTLLMQGREDEAISKLSQLRRTSKEPHQYDLILGRYFYSKNDYSHAESILLEAVEKESSSAADYLLALVYMKQKKHNQALERLKTLQSDDDEYQNATHLQVKILQDMKKSNEASLLLQKRIADKEHVQPLDYLLLAALYQDLKKNRSAIDVLERSIQTFPKDEQLLFELGLLYEKNGQQEKALNRMQQLLTINKNHAEALNYIGYTWADNNVHLHQALDYIQQAIKLRPNNGYIHDSLGWVYFRLHDLEKARKELEHAIALAPDDPYIHDHLADVYVSLSLQDKAFELYRKALDLFSQDEEKEKIKKKIESINRAK